MEIDTKAEVARITGGATLVTIWGITLNEWVAIATLIYMLFNGIVIFPKVLQTVRGWIDHFKNRKS